MAEIFVYIHHFLAKRRWLMWLLLITSTVLFFFFGMHVNFEENVSKLLPENDMNTDVGIAFTDMQVKDKIFLQFAAANNNTSLETLADACDTFVEHLLLHDSTTHYIDNILYRIDDDLTMNLIDYAMGNLPLLVDTGWYADIDRLLQPDSLNTQMARNKQLLDNDPDRANLISYDPANLRRLIVGSNHSTADALGGNFCIINNHIFAKDSSEALAFVAPNISSLNSKAGTRLVALIEAEQRQMKNYAPDVKLYFHGAPVNSVGNSRLIKQNLLFTVGLSLLIICCIVWFSLKNTSTLPMLLLPIIYGVGFALSFVYWIKGSMSLLAIGIGAVVLGVALSYCLHILIHYKYVNDPVRTLREQSIPIILSCVTTIGAFTGLLFTRSPLLHDFGIFASFALVGTTLFCLIFLPHFFRPEKNRHSERIFHLLEHINAFPIDRQKWFIVGLLIVCAVCIVMSANVEFDSDLKNIGYTDPRVAQAQQLYTEKNNRGCTSLYFAAVAHDLDSAILYSRALNAKFDSLQCSGLIRSHTKSTALLQTKADEVARMEYWQSHWTPARVNTIRRNIAAAAKANGLEPKAFEAFIGLLESEYTPVSLLNADIVPTCIMSNVLEYTNNYYLVFTSALIPPDHRQQVTDTVVQLPHIIVVDPFYYTQNLVKQIHDDLNYVLLFSMIFVFIILLLSFRSVSRTVLAFLPMVLSWYVVLGVMALFGIRINLINIVISTFIFGIGVDYSIYIMDGLLADTRRNDPKLITYHKTAILLSAIVLIITVASLLAATHPAIRSVGIITFIGMITTVLITYTVLPPAFRLLAGSKLFGKKFGRKPKFDNRNS